MVEKYGWILSEKGCINYLLFKLAKRQCSHYDAYRIFLGELTCAQKEIKRRLGEDHKYIAELNDIIQQIYDKQVAPYEDKKIKENGDVE